jgi:hypothetical protein
MDFLDIAVKYGRNTLGEPVLENEASLTAIPWNMWEAFKLAKNKREAEDSLLASLGALSVLEKDRDEDPDDEDSIVNKILSWLGMKVGKMVAKSFVRLVFRSMFNAVRWLVTDVLGGALGFAIRSLALPLLEMVTAILLTPEILIAAGIGVVLAGLGWLGKLMFDRFFRPDSEFSPSGVRETTNSLDNSRILTPQQTVGRAAQPSTRQRQQFAAPGNAAPVRGTVTGAQFERIESLIARGEGDYNSVNYSSRGPRAGRSGHEDLVHMTIGEIREQQRIGNYNAVGRYQLIQGTLTEAVNFLNLSPNTLFSVATQDMIFQRFLIGHKRKVIMDYIQGRTDNLWGAVLASAQEWASVAAPQGATLYHGGVGNGLVSYYSGVQGNHASITAQEMATVLQQERAQYANGGQPTNSTVATGTATAATQSSAGTTVTPRGTAGVPASTPGQRELVNGNRRGQVLALAQ